MKRKEFCIWSIVAIVLVTVALLLLIWLADQNRAVSQASQEAAERVPHPLNIISKASPASNYPVAVPPDQTKQTAIIVESILSTPIEFFGKVQDQYGTPIAEVKVEYSAIDKFWKSGSKYEGFSDQDGLFSLAGVGGAGLTVGVIKDGYDGLNGLSYQAFGYGMPPDSHRKAPPTKANPAIFGLRKKAEAEPLVRISSRQFDISRNGEPTEVDLLTGKSALGGRADVRVECTIGGQSGDRYDWKCRVSVPGGGLTERNAELDFEAPEGGYSESEEIAMAANNPQQKWSREAERHYFLRLADGHFARAKLTFYTGARTFFVLESFLNPSGSRALEYDPTKKAPR